jgi:hypothetical protein
VEQRLAELNEIEMTDNLDTAFVLIRKIGIRFFIALGERGPRFDPERTHAVFSTTGAVVYRID